MEKKVSDKLWIVKGENPKLAEWKVIRTSVGWALRASKSRFDKNSNTWKESEWLDPEDVRNLLDLGGEALALHERCSQGRISTDNSSAPKVRATWEDDDDGIPF